MVLMRSKRTNDWREMEIRCDGLISDIILHLDNGKCALCGETCRMSSHHIIKRGKKLHRHNPHNHMLLCGDCHDQAESSHAWFLEQLEEKYPKMYDWNQINVNPPTVDYYGTYLKETIYPALMRIKIRMIVELKAFRIRFGRE